VEVILAQHRGRRKPPHNIIARRCLRSAGLSQADGPPCGPDQGLLPGTLAAQPLALLTQLCQLAAGAPAPATPALPGPDQPVESPHLQLVVTGQGDAQLAGGVRGGLEPGQDFEDACRQPPGLWTGPDSGREACTLCRRCR
jgi:hypothetical protein